jgi:hypothetical protein
VREYFSGEKSKSHIIKKTGVFSGPVRPINRFEKATKMVAVTITVKAKQSLVIH